MSYLWLSGFAGVPDCLFCCCALSHRICVDLIPEEFSEPEDRLRTPVPEQADSSSPEYEFGGRAADDAPMAGQKRRPNFPQGDELRRKASKDESAASLRRGGKSVISAEADESVATLPRTALERSKSFIDKDESAASLTRGGKSVVPFKDDNVANLPRTASGESKPTRDKDESAASPRVGGKSVIPAMRDVLANLPTSALGGSKSSDELDGGGLKPSVEQAASRLDPQMNAIHAYIGLV
jgi:hypothetical protein